MYITQQQEQFSLAYVQVIAAVAGFAHYAPSVDDDSIDAGLAARREKLSTAPRFEMQLKCTGGEKLAKSELSFDLSLKNYDDLRMETLVPRIFVVILVPKKCEEWLTHDESSAALHYCGYWVSLLNQPQTTNETGIRVKLPRAQIFNVQSVTELMEKVDQGLPL